MAETVIGRALVVVFEYLVGLADFLELLLRLLVAGIAIGMVLHGELAVGGLERVRIRVAGDSQCLVIIALGHVSHTVLGLLIADGF